MPAWSLLILGTLVLAWTISEFLYPRRVGPDKGTDGYSSEIMGLSMLLNMAVLVALLRLDIGRISWHPPVIMVLGALLAAAGTALRYAAILTLGRYFTSAVVIQDAQPLVQHGPFRWLRHPGYAGNLFFGLGIALMLVNGLGCLFYLLSHGLAMHYRVRVEERALRAAFGAAYDDYSRQTWRMVPFLY